MQECENFETIDPEILKELKTGIGNFFWKGENKNKGLAVLGRKGIKLESLNWNENFRGRNLKYFLPVLVEGKYKLLGVWAHKAEAKAFAYIGQFWQYMENNKDQFNDIVIGGDFNSNSIWDSWDRWWNHTDCINELEKLNIFSVYHKIVNEEQGEESRKTFFHRKNRDTSYHIDYFLASGKWICEKTSFSIGRTEEWLDNSDHMPLILELPM